MSSLSSSLSCAFPIRSGSKASRTLTRELNEQNINDLQTLPTIAFTYLSSMPLSRSIKSLVLAFDLRRRVTPVEEEAASCDEYVVDEGFSSADGELTIPMLKSWLSDDRVINYKDTYVVFIVLWQVY